MKKLLSRGNPKLAKDGIVSFGLPAGMTCPGAKDCRQYCYAMRGCYRFRCVNASRQYNYKASQGKSFIKRIVNELKGMRNIKAVRIHDSGDFYSQQYLDKWIEIAKQLPDITFYCYTKSLHLNWKAYDSMPNMSRTQSLGGRFDSKVKANVSKCIVGKRGSASDNSDLNSIKRMFKRQTIKLTQRNVH